MPILAPLFWQTACLLYLMLKNFLQSTQSDCIRRALMLWTIFVILLILWLLGMVSSYTLGGFIHILLILALAVVLIRIIQGQRPI